VLVDTETARRRQAARFGLPLDRFVHLPQGQDDRIFRPRVDAPAGSPPGEPLEVLFVGTYVPLQGVGTVLEAAARLVDAPVRFRLIGDGQEARAARAQAGALGLNNVVFDRRWHTAPELAEAMHRADICLGIFGTGEKAGAVVPLKAVAALAVGRPLITRDSAAAREVLAPDVSACLVPPGDGEALAAAIRELAADRERRELLGAAGREVYRARMSPDALGRQLETVFENLVEERTRTLATV
jgi:glycosyltransferase involved in cell wall biosynthesis